LLDGDAFSATVKDDGQWWTVTLLPRKKDLRHMYTTIVLSYNPKTGNTERVEMTEKSGDRTVIELRNIQKDKSIDANVFKVD
jgi:outer membrane lipoprotein-sorting protein